MHQRGPQKKRAAEVGKCGRVGQALWECQRRVGGGAECRHLNRKLAECMIGEACPEETEAVRSLCASGGTQLKRDQCHQARVSLSLCLSSLQRQLQDQHQP